MPIEQKQTLTIQQAIDLAVQHHTAGDLPKAESIYNQILQAGPNQPDALHLLGVISHQVGKNDIAVDLISKALSIKPDFADAHNNLGLALHELGLLDEAVASYNKAIAIKPGYADALYNLGNALKELGRLDEALSSYNKAIAIKHNYAEAHSNLGTALQELRQLDEAVASYNKAIAIKPDYPEAHYNLGNALNDLGQLDEAVDIFNKAISIKPDYAEAYCNLGNALRELRKLDEAVTSYNKALAIKPDFAEAHYNLGNALNDLGSLDEAVTSYKKALDIKPDLDEVHNNLKIAIKALMFSRNDLDHIVKTSASDINDETLTSINFALQQFFLEGFRPHEADESFNRVITALPAIADETIQINATGHQHTTAAQLPNKMVALLHLGRSGTGLLHSLVDGHPKITTLPSVYLRGYFNEGVWDKISADGWRGLPARFADKFAVLFDARTSRPIPSRLGETSISIGKEEGMTSVGENRDQFLSLDKEAFCKVALNLMEGMKNVDPMSFLMIVHAAFEKVIEANENLASNKQLCFYHIHNPDDYAMANFLRYAPDVQLLVAVREPIQKCESWIRNSVEKSDYHESVLNILGILLGLDQVPFRMRDTVGVRLEDLKIRPEATMKALCAWLKVADSPTLYEMTAQGEKCWGAPTDPGFNAKHANPFDQSSIKRPVGKILGETDQFVLGTLFYPFSVRFGYREPEPEQFQKDLKEIRPLIDDMMDFEKAMAKALNVDQEQFKKQGSYQLLRAGLIDRWNVLDELGDYPYMLVPLSI
jgi:tetratricopeptide (TPR) repeat protein